VVKNGKRNKDAKQKRFINTLFHEFKIPISAISGYCNLLASGDLGKLSKPQDKAVRKIQDLSFYTTELINNITSLSRQGGRRRSEYEKICPVEIVNKALDTLSGQIRSKKLNIHFDCAERIAHFWGAPVDIQQIMLNLLSNAVKFTHKAGHIRISIARKANRLIFSVKDTGIGIPKNAIKKISRYFYRADNAVRGYEGSGMGLAIVKELLRRNNNGKMIIRSKINKGTEVVIILKDNYAY